MPLTLVANEAVYSLFLEQRFEQSTEVITVPVRRWSKLAPDEEQNEALARDGRAGRSGGLLGEPVRFGGPGLGFRGRRLSLGEKIDRIQARAADLIEHLVQLSVVFILQTGLLPIAFFWLFLQMARLLLRPVRD